MRMRLSCSYFYLLNIICGLNPKLKKAMLCQALHRMSKVFHDVFNQKLTMLPAYNPTRNPGVTSAADITYGMLLR